MQEIAQERPRTQAKVYIHLSGWSPRFFPPVPMRYINPDPAG
jgi:hypothetical protein